MGLLSPTEGCLFLEAMTSHILCSQCPYVMCVCSSRLTLSHAYACLRAPLLSAPLWSTPLHSTHLLLKLDKQLQVGTEARLHQVHGVS